MFRKTRVTVLCGARFRTITRVTLLINRLTLCRLSVIATLYGLNRSFSFYQPTSLCNRRKQARQEQSDYGVVDRSHPPLALIPPNLYEDAHSTVKECTAALGRANHSRTHDIPPPVAASGPASMTMVECELYSESFDALGGLIRNTLPLQTDISPYACFYSVPKSTLKTGWLDKLSPQG